MGLERLFFILKYFLRDKIHQKYPLDKFLNEVKRLFKPKDKYLMSLNVFLSL
jgi:hypothetical protein